MEYELKSLIDKLNPVCRKALEAAAGLCVSQTNYNVEVEHFLLKLLDIPNTDLTAIFKQFDVSSADVSRDLMRAIERLKRGNSGTPAFSPHLPKLVQEAWLISSLHVNAGKVRTGAILLALLDTPSLRGLISESVPALAAIPRDGLRSQLRDLLNSSAEGALSGAAPAMGGEGGGAAAAAGSGGSSSTEALDQYTHDLTAQARSGKIDPISGRDLEIRQIVDILTRRRQNNPILTGEAGVGKTAVVEGFALRIVAGDVPEALRNVTLRTLDLGLLQAGAGVKGEFENRLKQVIAEVKGSPKPIILFIDEAHTMIGAGGAAGQNDAANLLKPALARGELRTIAATTWAEYKKYFEKDPALTRRFQPVKIEEPTEEKAMTMLRGIVKNLEKHHKVQILDEAVKQAVSLSHRYISGRQLPDKAVSVLDTACARVAIGQNSSPADLEGAISNIARIELELSVLRREQISSKGHAARIIELTTEMEATEEKRKILEGRWQQELDIVGQIRDLQIEVEEEHEKEDKDEEKLQRQIAELEYLRDSLEALQANEPMVHSCVNPEVVASVISGWTGIPIGKMLADEIKSVLVLEQTMGERIIGQQQALDAISRRIRTSRAELLDPEKPVGVFMLVGPSGVGKTETAVTIADLLYGGERNLITINMSEYQEAHTVSSLKGSPPGYVGYGQGGVLTEAVRRNPYSVVLLDEVEKAHPDVMELFYQVFDKGRMEDGEGIEVDFKNTIILLTSNIATDRIMKMWRESDKRPDPEALVENIRPELVKHFKPALLGRMVIIPYYPLGDNEIRNIARLKLGKIQRRFQENHRAELVFDDDLINAIAERCTEVDSGARNIDHILTQTLLPELSERILERMAQESPFWSVRIALSETGGFDYRFTPPVPEAPSDDIATAPAAAVTGREEMAEEPGVSVEP